MTTHKVTAIFASALLLVAAACSKRGSDPGLVVEIPPGFTGNFVLEMGSKDAGPLPLQGDSYVVMVKSGKMATSTFLAKPKVTFNNAGNGAIWGYSQTVFNTGDGIPVGGKIEFFVGTQKEYEAEQSKKNHSGKAPSAGERRALG